MMVSGVFALLVLAVVVAILAAIVYGVVSLVSNRNALGIIAGVLAVPVIAVMALFFLLSARVVVSHNAVQQAQIRDAEIVETKALARQYAARSAERVRANAPSQPLSQPVEQAAAEENATPVAKVAASKADPEVTTPAAGKKSTSMLRMLASALLKAIDEQDAAEAKEKAKPPKPVARTEAPSSRPAAVPKRPAWVDAMPGAQDGAYQAAVSIGPYTTRMECDVKRPEELQRAIDKFVVAKYGRRAAGRIQLPSDFVDRQVVKAEWEERREFDLSPTTRVPMVQLHLLLRFDRAVANRIDDIWTQADVLRRVEYLAAVGAAVILVLAVAWAYLMIDLSTAGRYRWRLRLAVSLLLLAIVAAGLSVLA